MSFAANPVDPSLRFSIRYVDLPKNAVPVKRHSSERGHAIVAAAIAGAGLSIAIALGIAGAAGAPAIQSPASPVTGEFRLGPGNQAPVGYVGRPDGSGSEVPGEFRLGPGNQAPVGYVGRTDGSGSEVPGEFRLGPGNQAPVGYVAE